MNQNIKINKGDLIFYNLAIKLSSIVVNYQITKKLLRYIKGTSEEHLYEEALYLNISKTILYFIVSVIISILLILAAGFKKEIILLSVVIISMLSILPFAKVKRNYTKNELEFDHGLENLVNELAILVSSGMSLDASIQLKRIDRNTYYVMNKFYKYLQNANKKGISINSAILGFSKIYKNKHLNKLNVLISQSKKKGTGKQAEALINLGAEIMNERKGKIKKKAEVISTKMLMPLMVSMIGIIIMIMVPIFMQF